MNQLIKTPKTVWKVQYVAKAAELEPGNSQHERGKGWFGAVWHGKQNSEEVRRGAIKIKRPEAFILPPRHIMSNIRSHVQ